MDPSAGRFTQKDSFKGMARDPLTLHKYTYGNNSPAYMVDPSGNVSLAAIMTGVSIVAIGATVIATDYFMKRADKGREVYVDFSGMSSQGYSKEILEREIMSSLQAAFGQFGVRFTESKPSAYRKLVFGGGGGGDSGHYGKTYFVSGRVSTDDLIEDSERYITPKNRRNLTSEEVGVAIGNAAAHEAGHTFGVPHIFRPDGPASINQPVTIMDSNMVPQGERAPWASASLDFLRERFQ